MLYNKVLGMYESIYNKRYDERKFIKYYTHNDFDSLNAMPIEFKSNNNQTLRGNLYYYNKSDKLCVFCHGMEATHHSYMHEIEFIAKSGFMVFSYDNTGVGMSDGDSMVGFSQSLVDLDYALRYIKNSEFKDLDLSLVGHSWGGFAVSNILNYHDEIKAIVSISAPISTKSIFSQFMKGVLKVFLPTILKVEKNKFPNYYNSSAEEVIKNTNTPILFIHSTDDLVVSCKNNAKHLEKINKNPKVEFLFCDNKNHNPNYTAEGVKYMNDVFSNFARVGKNMSLEEKMEYFKEVDFKKMVIQDSQIMAKVCNFIKRG